MAKFIEEIFPTEASYKLEFTRSELMLFRALLSQLHFDDYPEGSNVGSVLNGLIGFDDIPYTLVSEGITIRKVAK